MHVANTVLFLIFYQDVHQKVVPQETQYLVENRVQSRHQEDLVFHSWQRIVCVAFFFATRSFYCHPLSYILNSQFHPHPPYSHYPLYSPYPPYPPYFHTFLLLYPFPVPLFPYSDLRFPLSVIRPVTLVLVLIPKPVYAPYSQSSADQ